MGNTTVWKPATTALLSNYYFMMILKEAGMPDGVINFIPGSGSLISSIVLKHKELAGIHFTGSNSTLNTIWKQVSENLSLYRSYPKIVGETGGKDFIFAHNSADPLALAAAIVRGAFEYQGQKCSAASRAYIPRSLWKPAKNHLTAMLAETKTGGEMDFKNAVNSVIDETSYDRIMAYIDLARRSPEAGIIAGGKGDKSM